MRNTIRKTPTRAGGIIFDKDNTHIILVLNKDSYYKEAGLYEIEISNEKTIKIKICCISINIFISRNSNLP